MDGQPTKINIKLLQTWTLGTVAVALYVGLGWWTGEVRNTKADRDMRHQLQTDAERIVHALNPDLVRQLTFTSADTGTPSFELLREQLKACSEDLPGRGIFTMARRGEGIRFGPESYNEDDPLASLPGTAYLQPPAEALKVFEAKQAATIGPYVDEFGSFVTALAPLVDPETGEVLLVLGLDYLPDQWQAEVAAVQRLPLFASVATIALLIGCGIAFLKSSRKNFEARLRFKAAIIAPGRFGDACWRNSVDLPRARITSERMASRYLSAYPSGGRTLESSSGFSNPGPQRAVESPKSRCPTAGSVAESQRRGAPRPIPSSLR